MQCLEQIIFLKYISNMIEQSYNILKTFFLDCEKNIEEVTFYFHPDNQNGEIDISFNDSGDYDSDEYLPELAALMDKSNLDQFDKEKYVIFKKHISLVLKKLFEDNSFKQKILYVYCQHVDEDKEIILKIEPSNKKNLFPDPQEYRFDLSMLNQERAKSQWWKVVTPPWQNDRPFQNLELAVEIDDEFVPWCGESLKHIDIKTIELISENKIKKLWDYESSDLEEVFSKRFCQMLDQIGVKNIEYYPLKVTCKATKQSSSTYYKLANIVGLVEGVSFYEKGKETPAKKPRLNNSLKAEKKVLDGIKEKIIRCKSQPQIFIIDNDIKEACEVNAITGIEFEEIELI
jgi:hypothetical protein